MCPLKQSVRLLTFLIKTPVSKTVDFQVSGLALSDGILPYNPKNIDI